MSGYLLDTHVFLWLAGEPWRVARSVHMAVRAEGAPVWISVASVWEFAVKAALGKLPDPPTDRAFLAAVEDFGARILPIGADHALAVRSLPQHHRDPFDRMLVVQAAAEGLVLVTADRALAAYGVPVLWADAPAPTPPPPAPPPGG